MGLTTPPRCVIPLADALSLLVLIRLSPQLPPASSPTTWSMRPALGLAALPTTWTSRARCTATGISRFGSASRAGSTCLMLLELLATPTVMSVSIGYGQVLAFLLGLRRAASLAPQFVGGVHRLGRGINSRVTSSLTGPTGGLALLVTATKSAEFVGGLLRLGAKLATRLLATRTSWRRP